jgi:hypothetical protein
MVTLSPHAAPVTPTSADAPLPALCAAVLAHLPALEASFRRMALRVEIARAYRVTEDGRTVATLRFRCDPQSDHLFRDERRVRVEACALYRHLGFSCDVFGGPCGLRITSYYGREVAA